MRKKNQLVSKIAMIMIFLFMTIRQLILVPNIQWNQNVSVVSDLSFIGLIVVITIILSVMVIYLPMLFIVNISFVLDFNEIAPLQTLTIFYRNAKLNIQSKYVYKKLNVVRC